MANSHTDGKPDREMSERQETMLRDVSKAMEFLRKAIDDAAVEEAQLAQQAATFVQAEQRGDTPDPAEVARVVAARTALVHRCDKFVTLMQTMGEEAEAVTQAANDVVFEALRRQFNAQFNGEEGL